MYVRWIKFNFFKNLMSHTDRLKEDENQLEDLRVEV